MLIYLAHAKANYASPNDGYVNALRAVGHVQTLYSFHFLDGAQALPIHEDLSGDGEGQLRQQGGRERSRAERERV